MEKNFWGLIWSSFLRIQGAVGILIALLFWFFLPNINISLGLALPVLIFLIVVVVTLFNAAYESFKMSKRILPRILMGKKQGARVLCLLEPSELFSYDTLVSFYYIEDSFEQLIGIGTVTNIQEDGKIQVTMAILLEGYKEVVKKLEQNESTVLNKIKVKPNIPSAYSDMLLEKERSMIWTT